MLFRWFHMTLLNIHISLHTFLINLQISSVETSIHVSLHFGCTFNISFNCTIWPYLLQKTGINDTICSNIRDFNKVPVIITIIMVNWKSVVTSSHIRNDDPWGRGDTPILEGDRELPCDWHFLFPLGPHFMAHLIPIDPFFLQKTSFLLGFAIMLTPFFIVLRSFWPLILIKP